MDPIDILPAYFQEQVLGEDVKEQITLKLKGTEL